MKLFNYIFYFILFLSFFLPSNTSFYVPIGEAFVRFSEIGFILLPIVNLFCFSKNQFRFHDRKIKKRVIIFLILILFTEIIVKRFYFGQGLGDALSAIRIGLPLFSSLILVMQGLRADVKMVWKVLLWAICSSVALSLISLMIPLPIYFDLKTGTSSLTMFAGRIMNANASFGVIGMYLLLEEKDKWFNQGKLVKCAAVLSVIALVLTFNRTLMAVVALEALVLVFKNFKIKIITKAFFLGLAFLGVIFFAYHSFETIQEQMDKRILSIVFGENTISESAIEGSRDDIYEAIATRINEGYWLIGLPYDKEIFQYYREGSVVMATHTDISIINVLLRNGIIALILFISILLRILKIKFVPPLILMLFMLASLNLDVFYKTNGMLFLLLFGLIYSTNFRQVDFKQSELGYYNKIPRNR